METAGNTVSAIDPPPNPGAQGLVTVRKRAGYGETQVRREVRSAFDFLAD